MKLLSIVKIYLYYTIFINSENSKTSEQYILILKLTDKLHLRRSVKSIALSNLSIYYTWKNIKSSYNNSKFKISAPTWKKLELHSKLKMDSLGLLTPGIIKLLGSTENKTTKDKKGENVSHLEIMEVVLVNCNIANNDYQQDSRVLYTFVSNKPFGDLLETSPTNHIFLKTFNSEFQTIKVWFTDQNSQLLEIEAKINLPLKIK